VDLKNPGFLLKVPPKVKVMQQHQPDSAPEHQDQSVNRIAEQLKVKTEGMLLACLVSEKYICELKK